MTTPPRGTRTAVYLRISSDRDGEALGVERQREDCLARIEREGWRLVGEYVDNDTGASSKSTKKRPRYAEMIEDAKAGKFDIILAYSASRLTRRPMEYETLIQLTERHRVQIRTITSGDADFSTADGRAVARTIAAWDAAEAERISERVSRKVRENAKAGKFLGGRRPFGFEADGVTIREDEASEIRKATDSILRGGSLRSVVKDWNSRGIKTATGRDWTPIAVKDVLVRPRNSGLIKYEPTEWGEDEEGNKTRKVNRSTESFGPASWEPIVSDDKRLAVVAILKDPNRKTSPGNQPTHLGSSIYLCGVCGSKVRTVKSGGRATRYVCNGGKGAGPNHLSRNVGKTDSVVAEKAVKLFGHIVEGSQYAEQMTGATAPAPEWTELTTELTAIETRRNDIQEDYSDGVIDRAAFRSMMDRLKAREEEVRSKMETGPRVPLRIFADVQGPGHVQDMWEAMSIEDKRKTLEIVDVTILPTDRRGTTFDPDSIQVTMTHDLHEEITRRVPDWDGSSQRSGVRAGSSI